MAKYGRPDGNYPVFEVGETVAQWPTIVVTFGEFTAVMQLCGVGADGDHPHLSIDVHAFVEGRLARCGVFGMEDGNRYEAFDEGTAPGTSHGWPAVQGVAVLIGRQNSRSDNG
jgi:hypothetical protein